MSTTGRPSQAGSAIRLVLVGLGIAVVIALAVWLYVVGHALEGSGNAPTASSLARGAAAGRVSVAGSPEFRRLLDQKWDQIRPMS